LLGLLLGLSVLARVLLDDPNSLDIVSGAVPPMSPGHLLGSDVLGRDLLRWCAYGITTSLSIGVAVSLASALTGVLIGTFAGYLRGWADAVLMRLVDLSLAVPGILIFMAASMVVQRSVPALVVLLASVSWIAYARIVRSIVLVERDRDYVAAARLAGRRRLGIVVGHLVPAAATPIVVLATLQVGFVMLAEGALSFLGLGLLPPTVSLGYMIGQGRDQLSSAWWIVVVPGIVLILLVVSVNLIGDGLRDRFHVDIGGGA
jgi:peptide/nickel transport system permease protein